MDSAQKKGPPTMGDPEHAHGCVPAPVHTGGGCSELRLTAA